MVALGWSSCRRKPECPKETHLSDLVLYVFDASTLICLFYIKILIPSPIQHMLIDHVIIQSGELSNKHVRLSLGYVNNIIKIRTDNSTYHTCLVPLG